MSVEFDRKIHDTLADANLQLAIYTATGRLKEKRIEVDGGRRTAGLPGTADAGQRAQEARHRQPGLLPGRVRTQCRGARRQGGLLQGRDAKSRDFVLDLAKRARLAADRQIEIDDHRRGGSQRAAGASRAGIGGDRPGRVHPATGAREAVSHRGAGAAQDALRRGGHFHEESCR